MNSFRKRNFDIIPIEQSISSIKAKLNDYCQNSYVSLLDYPGSLQQKNSNLEYADKCHLFWNNFDRPAKPLLLKPSFDSDRGKKRISRSIPAKRLARVSRPRITNKSEVFRRILPPITKILSRKGQNEAYQTWEVDSDDEYGLVLNKY